MVTTPPNFVLLDASVSRYRKVAGALPGGQAETEAAVQKNDASGTVLGQTTLAPAAASMQKMQRDHR
jgi:hypothetical protein